MNSEDKMKIEKIDFFQPLLIVIAIIVFLAMGYIGSFNYRFEDPLKPEVILTILFSCLIFTFGVVAVKYKVNVDISLYCFRNKQNME